MKRGNGRSTVNRCEIIGSVGKDLTLTQQPTESLVAVEWGVVLQIVGAQLVDSNAYYQPGRLCNKLFLSLGGEPQETE